MLALSARFDGDDVFAGKWYFLVPHDGAAVPQVVAVRVGVNGPGEAASNFTWRYWIADSSSVSAHESGRI